jgi:hypothetical protein
MMKAGCAMFLLVVLFGPSPCLAESGTAHRIAITLDSQASTNDLLVAETLKQRLLQISDLAIQVGDDPADLRLCLGQARSTGKLKDLCDAHNVVLPGRTGPAPEGFAIKSLETPQGRLVVAFGADARGLLYAAGEVLRRFRYGPDSVTVTNYSVAEAPAFRFRGFSANQGGTMMKITKARSWTEAEIRGVALEYALAGGNTFYAGDNGGAYYDFIKSYGLMTTTGARPNQLLGEHPREWRAGGRESWEGTNWVCPSIPEARAALLAQWDKDFSQRAHHEVMRFYAGDPGGCTDARCRPWGKTFIQLCEEMAAIWLKHHPKSIVLIANQGLDNAGERAIFDYYKEEPCPWSYGIAYGPGSNPMSRYFRRELRNDLFIYPGKGPVDRYLAEMLHELPLDQHIMNYSDITHWIRSQYQIDNPEPNIVKAYNRRMFHARPKAMYRIFQAIMPFSEGDIIYSEGNHDEFHQYLWARLLWNPNRELEDVMREYCVLYFGEDSAEPMIQALFQLEQNLVTPLDTNAGIGRYYALVKEAGDKMPPWRMKRDYRWRLHMQKAALDQYLQYKLRNEMSHEQKARDVLTAVRPGQYESAIKQALDILRAPTETDEMKKLRDEAGKLGEESDRLHGDRNLGYFKLDQPLRNIPGETASLEEAQSAKSDEDRKTAIESVIELTNKRTSGGRRE